jgi:hypothetical protein
MFDFSAVVEFSRNYCVTICAVLIPLNLLTTLGAIALVAFNTPIRKVKALAIGETFFASLILFHVSTWLMIGVVQLITFILIGLSSTCLIVTWGIVLFSDQFRELFSQIKLILAKKLAEKSL